VNDEGGQELLKILQMNENDEQHRANKDYLKKEARIVSYQHILLLSKFSIQSWIIGNVEFVNDVL
jgi:hypothetical protein